MHLYISNSHVKYVHRGIIQKHSSALFTSLYHGFDEANLFKSVHEGEIHVMISMISYIFRLHLYKLPFITSPLFTVVLIVNNDRCLEGGMCE